MIALDRDPIVNLPPACTDGRGTYVAWTYYVSRTATRVSGVEIPLGDDCLEWSPVNIVDRANNGINRYSESTNRAGAIVVARHCQNYHGNEGSRAEIGDTYIVANERGKVPLGPTQVSYDYQTAESFEPWEQLDWAQPLFLPFSQGTAFPETITPVSQGLRRFFVAVPTDALLIDRKLLERE